MSTAETFHVLLIEDSAADAERIERELKTAGVRISARRVETREKFLNVLQEFQPDIVLAEYSVPGFSALEAIDLLRQAKSDIPFLIVTEGRSDEEAVECIRRGADGYISKRNLTRLPSELLRALSEKKSERVKKKTDQELREYTEELRAFSSHLQFLREEERNRLAEEIHDELAQTLTALRWDITWLQNKISTLASDRIVPLQEHLLEMSAHADSTIKSVRRILDELKPRIMEGFGIIPAIDSYLEGFQSRTGIHYKLTSTVEDLALSPECSTEVFRFLQDTLADISPQAAATEVRAGLALEGGRLKFSIENNGKSPAKNSKGGRPPVGESGLMDRARKLGGSITVTHRQGGGTTLTLEMPVMPEKHE